MKLSAENFMSIKQLEFDFSQLPKIVLLLGPNGAGKTALFDLFLWVITGKTSRGTLYDELIKKGESYVLGKINFNQYTIVRTRNHPIYGTDLSVYVNDTIQKFASINETQKFISKIFSYEELIATSYLFQSSLILDLSENDRKSIFAYLLKLEAIEKAKEMISSRKQKITSELAQINSILNAFVSDFKFEIIDTTDMKNELESINKKLNELSVPYNEYLYIKKKISELSKIQQDVCPLCLRSLTLAEKKKIIDTEMQKLEQLMPYHDEYIKLTEKASEIRTQLLIAAEKEANYKKQKEIIDKLEELKIKKETLDKELSELLILEEAFSNKGAITLILEQLTHMINERLTTFNEILFDDTKLEISLYKTLKSGELRPGFEIKIQRGKTIYEYKNLSSGEKKRANLILLLTLCDLFNRTGILFCDEVFDHLDSAGIENLIQLIEMLTIEHIIITSHSADISDYFPYTILVRKLKNETIYEI